MLFSIAETKSKTKNCHDIVCLTMEEEAAEEVIRTAIIHAGEEENVHVK